MQNETLKLGQTKLYVKTAEEKLEYRHLHLLRPEDKVLARVFLEFCADEENPGSICVKNEPFIVEVNGRWSDEMVRKLEQRFEKEGATVIDVSKNFKPVNFGENYVRAMLFMRTLLTTSEELDLDQVMTAFMNEAEMTELNIQRTRLLKLLEEIKIRPEVQQLVTRMNTIASVVECQTAVDIAVQDQKLKLTPEMDQKIQATFEVFFQLFQKLQQKFIK